MKRHFPSSCFPGLRATLQGRRGASGFTMTELIVTMSIVAILTVIAVPAFQSLVANQRVSVSSSELMATLAKARSEAIKRNAEVTITPASTSSWASGWRILDAASATLANYPAIAGVTIVGPSNVIYQSTGRIKNVTSPTFDIGAANGTGRACVQVDLSGLPSRKTSSC